MSETLVARRYAGALYEASLGKNLVDKVEKELHFFTDTIKGHNDLYRLLLSPRISSGEKKAILIKIFDGKISGLTLNFVSLLVDKKREKLFDYIASVFSEIILENSNRVIAEVTTAFPLSPSEKNDLVSSLSRSTGKSVSLEIKEDSSIIGGIIVRIEDKVYDGSLLGHLKKLEKEMSEVKVF